MYCKKCGAEVAEKDKFCYKCGSLVEIDETVDFIKSNENKEIDDSKTNTKKKKKYLIGAIIAVILIGTLVLLVPKTEEHNLDVVKASEILFSDQVSEYYGDVFNITGILLKNPNNEGYYSLVSSLSEMNATDVNLVVFTYDGELPEQVGTGSEVIIKGKIKEDSSSSVIVAEEIEVLKEDSIYYTDVLTILEDSDYYVGKKVVLTGRLTRNVLHGYDSIVDLLGSNELIIAGNMTTAEFVKEIKDGSVAIFSGTIQKDESILKLKIDTISHTEDTKQAFNQFIEAYSVSELYSYSWDDGEVVAVYGKYVENGSYSVPYSVCDLKTGQYISINAMVDFKDYLSNDQVVVLTGYLYRTGTGYRLDVARFG